MRRDPGESNLKDYLFFPLVLIVAILMVLGSIMVGANAPQCGPFGGADGPADYSFATIKGQNLCRMEGRKGYELQLANDILTIRGEAEENYGELVRSPQFKLGADLETVYAGQKLTISLQVKPTEGAGAMAFEAMYSTGKAGNSGWQRFDLIPDWQTYQFEYQVPEKLLENTVAYDYFAVRPVVPEKVRGIMIREIEFRRAGF